MVKGKVFVVTVVGEVEKGSSEQRSMTEIGGSFGRMLEYRFAVSRNNHSW